MLTDEEDQTEKAERKWERAGWMLKGGLLGAAAAIVLLMAGIYGYAGITGSYVVFGPLSVATSSANDVLDSDTIQKIQELLAYVDLYYNDEVDEDAVRDAIYKGTLDGLGDKYSVYYTAEEYEELQTSTSGNYYGIGAALKQDSDTGEVTISKVYSGTPAEEAGLLEGDQIVQAGDYTAADITLSELVKQIRGEEGTTVHLVIYRASEDKTFEADVERRNVELPSVESAMLTDTVGYIQITEFQEHTATQFSSAVQELTEQGMKGLVLDLRDNPGGLLTSVKEIADEILPEGTIVYTEDKYGKRNTYTSDADSLDMPLAVLVNGNSASASEILAGAVKDYGCGTLIGTTTFGKGIVQSLYTLDDGSAIKLTTAKYYTPNGNYIHGVGIDPDIELEYSYSGPEDGEYDRDYDNQLQKALETVEEQIP